MSRLFLKQFKSPLAYFVAFSIVMFLSMLAGAYSYLQAKQIQINADILISGEVRTNNLCIGGTCRNSWPGLGYVRNGMSYYIGGINFFSPAYTTLATFSTGSETPNVACGISALALSVTGTFCGSTILEFVCNGATLWSGGNGIAQIYTGAPASCELRGRSTCPGPQFYNGSYPIVSVTAACYDVSETPPPPPPPPPPPRERDE